MMKWPIEQLKNTVVNIEVKNSRYLGRGEAGTFYGTGFVVDKKQGYILTNAHVIGRSPSQTKITFFDGSSVFAKVIYYDNSHDFSILEFNPKDTAFSVEEVKLGSYFDLKLGDDVLLIGNNEAEEYSVKEGRVVQLIKNKGSRHSQTIQTSFDRTGGSSGSPVWNDKNEVVGMHFKGTNTSSFELVIDYAKDKLKDLVSNQPFQRGEVGLELKYLNLEDAIKFFSLPKRVSNELHMANPDIKYVIAIAWIIPGVTSANKALKNSDILYKINDELILDNLYRVDQIIDSHINKTIQVEVFRYGKIIKTDLVVKNAEEMKTNCFAIFGGGTFHDPSIAEKNYWRLKEQGLYMSQADPGSNFSGCGYSDEKVPSRKAILVQTINEQKISNLEDFLQIVKNFKHGDHITVGYLVLPWENVEIVSMITLDLQFSPLSVFEYNSRTHVWQKNNILKEN